LNNRDVLWRVAVFHHPWISSGVVGHLGSWMEWPWNSWGIDVCLTGHDHFYERLESNDVTLIVQGAGGASLYSFPNNPPQSKFRWNSNHGYSLIESRGNKLTFSLYDMYGNFIPDTGTTSLPSHSIENGSLVIEKNYVALSDKPFNQSDKYIVSDPIPIFNGEIFNLMVRKNEPDADFEYNAIDDLIPTKLVDGQLVTEWEGAQLEKTGLFTTPEERIKMLEDNVLELSKEVFVLKNTVDFMKRSRPSV
jgi:hypothetical protein